MLTQLSLLAKSSDWFNNNNTQITNHLQPAGFSLCPECQTHSWILPHCGLTVGPVAPVRCTRAVLSPVCVRGVCLLGSAGELCYETRPLTAGLLVDGPALPGNPETESTHTFKEKDMAGCSLYYEMCQVLLENKKDEQEGKPGTSK